MATPQTVGIVFIHPNHSLIDQKIIIIGRSINNENKLVAVRVKCIVVTLF